MLSYFLKYGLCLEGSADAGEVRSAVCEVAVDSETNLRGSDKFLFRIGLEGVVKLDDGGFPLGKGWEEIAFPAVTDEHAYALEISGDSMKPAYRSGDVIIVSPGAAVRKGDRVVVKTRDGEVMVKELKRKTAKSIELKSLNAEHRDRTLSTSDIVWVARIVWASQ